MRFQVEDGVDAEQERLVLVYRSQDYAFDVEPRPLGGGWSLLVNDLQLEVDEAGRVLYLWGLCPSDAWSETCDSPPAYRRGALRAEVPDDFAPGQAMHINRKRWPVSVNRHEGWVRIGEKHGGEDCVEFANGMVACLAAGRLTSIWLRPASLP